MAAPASGSWRALAGKASAALQGVDKQPHTGPGDTTNAPGDDQIGRHPAERRCRRRACVGLVGALCARPSARPQAYNLEATACCTQRLVMWLPAHAEHLVRHLAAHKRSAEAGGNGIGILNKHEVIRSGLVRNVSCSIHAAACY